MKKSFNYLILAICLFSVFTFTFLYGVEKTSYVANIYTMGRLGDKFVVEIYNVSKGKKQTNYVNLETYNKLKPDYYYKVKLNKYYELLGEFWSY